MKQIASALALTSLLASCYRDAPPSRFPSARAALDRMQESVSCSRGLSGEAKIDYFGAEGRVRGSVLYLVEAPDHVRLDLFSPFGVTLSTLTANGSRFTLSDLRKRRFLYGPANSCNLKRFTRVPLPPQAFAQLLRGEAPILKHSAPAASISWEKGSYAIRIASAHQTEELIRLVPVDADYGLDWSKQRLHVLEVSVSQAGVPIWQVELADHAPVKMSKPQLDPEGLEPPVPPSGPECRAAAPRRLRFVVGDAESEVVLVSHEMAHNPPLSLGVFEQQQPPGFAAEASLCRD
ncbi:MAG TPA: hypothetical protein VFQ61_09480 [Polyangiaceae bacterium]|nr:hypothetical protein [Polyangiaceae bacterium]